MIARLSIDTDNVIKGLFVTGISNYEYALHNLVPLIERLDIQRTLQDTKFYQRLERDLVNGCIMPPITIAFIREKPEELTEGDIEQFINENIPTGFILDGIQRLSTLKRTFDKHKEKLDTNRSIYLNILICPSMDNLLYRMITLNNGQKPMSARHQIEILTNNLIDFQDTDVPIVTEKTKKEQKIRVAFDKDTFVKGYLAFLANSTNIENKKIIEETMDQLIADKIMDSEITNDGLEFSFVIEEVNRLSESVTNFRWLKNANNFIGFCVGIRSSLNLIQNLSKEEVESAISNYEKAFSNFKYSQIKVGKYRRDLGQYFFQNIERMKDLSELELIDELSQVD